MYFIHVIKKFKKSDRNLFVDNVRFFEYHVRILALKIGENLIWYGTLCIRILICMYVINFMQIKWNPNDLLYTVGNPWGVIFILITTLQLEANI